MIKKMLSKKLTISSGKLIAFSLVCILIGIIAANYVFSVAESKRHSQDATLKSDMDSTLRFMKEAFMTDPTTFIHPDSDKIKALAKNYKTPEQIYDFVKKTITYDSTISSPSDFSALEQGKSSCFGFAALVVALLRANGVGPEAVHVSVSKLQGDSIAPHAWAELKTESGWKIIDPTSFVSSNYYAQKLILPREEYLAPWPKANILFEYNDKYFTYDLGY